MESVVAEPCRPRLRCAAAAVVGSGGGWPRRLTRGPNEEKGKRVVHLLCNAGLSTGSKFLFYSALPGGTLHTDSTPDCKWAAAAQATASAAAPAGWRGQNTVAEGIEAVGVWSAEVTACGQSVRAEQHGQSSTQNRINVRKLPF